MSVRKSLVAVCGLVLAGGAFAETYTWVYRADVGTSPMNAALWSDAGNWDAKGVPSASDTKAVVDLRSATNRYIRLPGALSIYQINGSSAGRPVLIGEETLTLTDVGSGVNPSEHLNFFVPVKLKGTVGSNYDRLGYVYFAGDLTIENGTYQGRDNKADIHFRQDWYANDDQETRTGIDFGPKSLLKEHYGCYHFYTPPALAESASSTWALTKGSPYATCVGAVSHVLPVGTHVSSGDLLPSGTFLKRIFPDGTVEFSNAAADDASATTVTFGAFIPDVQYSLSKFQRVATDGGGWLYLNQGTELGSMRLVLGTLPTAGYTTRTYNISSDSGYKPGTLVVSNATAELYVKLSNGRIEFRGTDAAGTGAGLPNGCLQTAGSANAVIVPAGVTATIKSYYESGIAAKLTKEGAGTLVLPAAAPAGSGKIVVKEGTVTFAETADGVPLALPGSRLEVAAGATLQLPKSGVRFAALPTCADGATITGPALLVVADALDASSLPLADNVQVVKVSQYDGFAASEYTWTAIPAATSPLDDGLPVPASWMDASDAASLVTSNGTDQVCLLQWKDVRGGAADGYPVANAASKEYFPEVVTNTAGRTHHVYIRNISFNTTKKPDNITNTCAMKYATSVSNVRAIFKAFNGCGHMICDGSYTWMRPYPSYNKALFYNGDKYDGIPGTFYVNGEVRSQASGFPYGDVAYSSYTDKSLFDPVVGEFHFTGSSLPKAAMIGYYGGAPDGGRNGYDRICEMIVYTNELTFVQRQKICAYLMKKWMHGAEANQDYGTRVVAAFDATGDVSVPVAAGKTMAFQSLTGSGTLVKSGDGDVYVETLENASGGLHVAAGKATVASTALTRDTLPGDPYLHLDASDATTITEGPTAGTIAAMADVRGAGHPSATVVNAVAGKYPTLVANAQGALPMVDYGTGIYGGDKPKDTTGLTGFTFPETDRLFAAFRIAGGQGGGLISGYLEATSSQRGGVLCTIPRIEGGTDWFAKYAWLWPDGGGYLGGFRALQLKVNSPGGTMFRLDGTNCVPASSKHPTGSVQLMMLNGFDRIYSNSLGCGYGTGSGTYWGGKSRDGETILYTNALSRASAEKIEAYLNKKWFGKETPGLRPAFVGSLAVDAGATLDIVGGAPVTASSFTSAGTVNGAVALTAGAPIKLVVNDDGSVSPMGVTGGVDFSQGGTVILTGNVRALTKGSHAVATALGSGFGAWTVSNEGLRANWRCRLVRTGDTVALEAIAPGLMLLVR